MKQCDWCEKEMLNQNFNKHQDRCFFKIKIAMKKSDFEKMKQNYKPPKELTLAAEMSLVELKEFLKESYNKTAILYKKMIVQDIRDPIDKLMEMHVSQPTKENYIREWILYNKWLKKNKKSPCKESADTYLASVKCKASTLKKKHYMLQNLLQYLFDFSVNLNKIKMRISYTPKYSMSDNEISEYLKEQREVDIQDYLIQRLLITYGLRVNTTSSLRIKHLEFLKHGRDKTIFLPDSKVKRSRREIITQDLMDLLTEFLGADGNFEVDGESFVFYPRLFRKDEKKRAHEFCIKINKRIKNSKVLDHNKNFKYSSHMFRKTKAFNIFQKGVEELKAKAREAIGQTQDSTAIDSYIYNSI